MLREICKNYIEEIKKEFDKEIEEAREYSDIKRANKAMEKYQIRLDTVTQIVQRYEEKEEQNS